MGNEHEEINIYFSNYAIAKNMLMEKFSNETQLKVLLLLSNRVLIPPTHFLKMSNESLEELSELKRFFDEGYICTTLYQGFSHVTDYLNFKIENDKGYQNVYKYRLEKLEGFFESEKSFFDAKDTKQGGEFSSILLEQIEEYKRTINNSKIEKEMLNEEKYIYELLANSPKGFLYKAEVEKEIENLSKNRKISKELRRDSLVLIDRSYLLAGAINNNSILSFSAHYNEIGLPICYGNHRVTNLAYSTEFFVSVLRALKIIDSVEEMATMNVNDILQLKRSKEFEKFIKEYSKLCDIVNGRGISCNSYEDSQILSEKQRNLKWWNRLSKCLIAIVALPLDIIVGNLDGGNPIPIYSIIVVCLEAFCSKSKFENIFEKNIVDKISLKLSKKVDVFSYFCLLLKEKIEIS